MVQLADYLQGRVADPIDDGCLLDLCGVGPAAGLIHVVTDRGREKERERKRKKDEDREEKRVEKESMGWG